MQTTTESAHITHPSKDMMGRGLGQEERRLVAQLRDKCHALLSPKYDTDFNLYRWLLNTEKVQKIRRTTHPEQLVSTTAIALNNHLKYRKLLHLDDETAPTWEDNPLYKHKLLPLGHLVEKPDKNNRFMWYIEYRSLRFENVLHAYNTSTCVKYHFLIYEHVLRVINEHERRTGMLSGVHHVIDMDGYVINPFMMLFLNNGALAYFANLIHYEHYPELVCVNVMVNCARWMSLPYKFIKSVMPNGFSDRFQLLDGYYRDHLLKSVNENDLPDYLGGPVEGLRTIESMNSPPEIVFNDDIVDIDALNTVSVHARHRKVIPIEVTHPNAKLRWYFRTDGEVWFGIFRPPAGSNDTPDNHKKELDSMQMVFPWLRVGAKFVPEQGQVECTEPGVYYFIFCNRQSWITKRHVYITIDAQSKRCRIDRLLSV